MAAVEPDRERVVADLVVEPGIDPSRHTVAGRGRKLLAEEHRGVSEARPPLRRVIPRDEEDRTQPRVTETLAEPIHDAGVEQDADRELIGKDKPDPLH